LWYPVYDKIQQKIDEAKMVKARIMVVEDERIVAKDIENRLKMLKYEVSGLAASGEDAVKKAGMDMPDLILMDIKLKGLVDGIEAARKIRDLYGIPIVYLTAYADKETLRRAKKTEPYGYIVKPFKLNDLLSAIEIALHKYKMDEKLRDKKKWLAKTFESINLALIAMDRQGRVKSINQAARNLTGWSTRNALNADYRRICRFLDRDGRDITGEIAAEVIENNREINLRNHLFVGRDDNRVPVNAHITPIIDDQGRTIGAVWLIEDISSHVPGPGDEEWEYEWAEEEAGGKARVYLPMCANCKRIRDKHGVWRPVERVVEEKLDVRITHGICPDCLRKLYPEFYDHLGEDDSEGQRTH